MQHRSTAEIIDFDDIPIRLGFKTKARDTTLYVTIVFWYDPEEYDYLDNHILHVEKVFFSEEEASAYCDKYKETRDLLYRTYPIE